MLAVRAMGCSVRRDGMLEYEARAGISNDVESFESMPSDPAVIGMTVEAFANTFGGRIVIDAIGNDVPVGFDVSTDSVLSELHMYLLRSFGNNVPFRVYSELLNERLVAIVDVSCPANRPITVYGGMIRSSGRNVPMSESVSKDLAGECCNDRSELNESAIECKRIRGSTVTDMKTFLGVPDDIISKAVSFIIDHITVVSLNGKDRFEIPLDSIREIVTNAVVHRSYNSERMISITVYDDHIGVISPGMLPYGISPFDAMHGCKRSRNPVVKRSVMREHHMGLKGAFEECIRNGLKAPSLDQVGEDVAVTLFRASAGSDDLTSAVLEFFRDNPRATIVDAADRFDTSVAYVRNSIAHLRDMGLLERSGSKKYGVWVISS